MIYATHKLYDCKHCITTYRVVETDDGTVSDIYNFECEKHSMQWYDAIILSTKKQEGCFFKTFTEIIEYIGCNSDGTYIYAYGVTYDTDGYILSQLS